MAAIPPPILHQVHALDRKLSVKDEMHALRGQRDLG